MAGRRSAARPEGTTRYRADTLVPGGRPSDPAITWRGRTWSYADLRALIDHSPVGAPLDVSTLPLPDALACLFAAARTGSSVLVRDPALAAPVPGTLPPGTWLAASTSGSTGSPRAVCRTAGSWARSMTPLADLAGLRAQDRVLLTGPLHATLHLHAAVHTLAIGAELTDEAATATAAHCVPAVLDDLLDSLPVSAPLRTVVVAGAALSDQTAACAAERGVAVTEYYGAAELSFVAARRLPNPALRPFPGVDVRVDADGVLWARSPYLALGYAGAGGPLRSDADGYATVGDLATVVPAGTDPGTAGGRHRSGRARRGDPGPGLVIRGRGDCAITTGGFTVLAEDVEAALERLDGVRAAAVVGTPHPRLGEVLTALVELEPGNDLALVRAAARRVLTGPARPRRYLVVDALPRTAGGKVARGALQRRLAAER